MHTPGPWRSVRTAHGAYYTHQIEVQERHIASIVGWTTIGTTCAITEENARLIEHAPDMAMALSNLLAWADMMGGWDAICWARAHTVLGHATSERRQTPPTSLRPTAEIVATAGRGQGWNNDMKLLLLSNFLDEEARRDPTLSDRLRQHLLDAASPRTTDRAGTHATIALRDTP